MVVVSKREKKPKLIADELKWFQSRNVSLADIDSCAGAAAEEQWKSHMQGVGRDYSA